MISKYIVTAFDDKLSIRQYLENFCYGSSKIKLLFEQKRILVNNHFFKEDKILKEKDEITISFPDGIDYIADAKKLDIIFEDDYILAVNKPCHILVHPDDKSKRGTMANIIAFYYQNRGWSYPIRYAHRLDMDTTGVLLFAKDPLSLAKLDALISTHELKRSYLCLALGKFKEKTGIIDAPIGEDRHHNQKKRISKTGKQAITAYEVLKEYKGYSLLKVTLKTGRTHQIRVHMAYIGHPLLGDALYGKIDERFPRVMLHSYEASFIHPVTHEQITIRKGPPFDMKKWI